MKIFAGPEFVKFLSLHNDFKKFLGGHLGLSSHCSILSETPMAGKTGWENGLSRAPII
jgi:hypothetical protein